MTDKNHPLVKLERISKKLDKKYTITYVRDGSLMTVTVWIDEHFNRQETDTDPEYALNKAVDYIVHKYRSAR